MDDKKTLNKEEGSTPGGIVYVGADHAGFEMKEKLKPFLISLGYEIEDKGAFALNNDDDYPDFVSEVALAVAKNPEKNRGIILGGSGQGEVICANKVKGIRAGLYYGEPHKMQIDNSGNFLDIIASTRKHNNANVLSIGARFISEYEVKKVIKIFLETSFDHEERHVRRINKIE